MISIRQTAIADSGFWFALFNERDQYHEEAIEKAEYLELLQILCPWPCLYETVNTRFMRRAYQVAQFERYLSRHNFIIIDDTPYRNNALRRTLTPTGHNIAAFSLVDLVVRYILDDVNIKTHYILTFNKKDFEDVCAKRQIEIL